MLRISIFAGLILFGLSLPTFGQSTQTPLPTPSPTATPGDDDVVRINSNLVQLDVTVTDEKGNPVPDLTPGDFEITENGVLRRITSFSFVSSGSTKTASSAEKPKDRDRTLPVVPAARLRPGQVRRTVALVVDNIGLSQESMAAVRQSLTKFVDTVMQPNDLVAIIRTSGGIGTLQQFTSDKRLLHAAIERLKVGANVEGASSVAALENKPVIPPGFKLDPERGGRIINAIRQDVYSTGMLGALASIVVGMRTVPGRKSLVVLSDGFRLFRGPRNAVDRTTDAMHELTDLANRASVVIYTVNARGLSYTGLTAADATGGMEIGEVEGRLAQRQDDLVESQRGLGELARSTGGFSIQNNNDLSGGLEQIVADQDGYYLIGYHPEEETFDPAQLRFNKFRVKVDRPGVKIRYRSGFIGVSDQAGKPTAPLTSAEVLAEAIESPFDSEDVKLRLTALFGNDDANGSFVRVLLHINTRDLSFSRTADDWEQANIELEQVTFSDDGSVADRVSHRHTIRLKEEAYQHSLEEGFVYTGIVPLKRPGGYQVRLALRDAVSNRIGSASQFVEIPDLRNHRLALSGMTTIGLEPASLDVKAVGLKTQSTNDDPLNGAALRRLKPGTILQYGCVIYNAQVRSSIGRPSLQVQTRLVREGQIVFDSGARPFEPVPGADPTRLSFSSALKLGAALTPGDYILQVIVTDLEAKGDQREARQFVDFEIVPPVLPTN